MADHDANGVFQVTEASCLTHVSADEIRTTLPAWSDLLRTCIEGGASIGFMLPIEQQRLTTYWLAIADAVEAGKRVVLALWDGAFLAGSVQLGLEMPENGQHRADLGKLLVHTRSRGKGYARVLMRAAEVVARQNNRTLVVLDTVAGSVAEGLYRRLGYKACGQIPDYARDPEGPLRPTVVFWKTLPKVEVRDGSPLDPEVAPLIDALSDYLLRSFGSDGRSGFSRWRDGGPGHCFAVAWSDARPVGCGAFMPRPEDPTCVELKRMYADPAVPGVGTEVLQYLLDCARAAGMRRVCLETRQANNRAVAFYHRHGFRPCQSFPPYTDRPESICLDRIL